jgi:hypothetical protein
MRTFVFKKDLTISGNSAIIEVRKEKKEKQIKKENKRLHRVNT